MSVSKETDPVEQVISILDAESGNWSHSDGDPDRIDRSEDHEPSEKLRNNRLQDVSLYVWSPAEGNLRKFDAEGTIHQTEVVQTDIYTNTASKTNSYQSDIVKFLQKYTNDNQSSTDWVTIWPTTPIDNTAQAFYREGFAIISVQCRLQDHNNPAGN